MKDAKALIARRMPDFVLLVYVLASTIGAFSGGFWASLGLGGGLILFIAVWYCAGKLPRPDTNLALLALIFMAATAALNLHSSQPDISWHEWLRLLTVFVPLLLLLSPGIEAYAVHPKFFAVIPVSMLLAGLALAAMLYVQIPANATTEILAKFAKYNRGFSYLVLLSFPIMAALWNSKKRWALLVFIILLFIPASFTESRTAKLALLLALATTVVAHHLPVLTRRLLALAPFVTLGWPFAAQWFFANCYDWLARMPDSWHARIEIWDYMAYRILEHPLLGWGLGTSATLDFAHPHGALYVFTKMPAAHPHNVTIQLWVELGLPGLLLGLAFALLALRKAARLDARFAPFALGAWVAAFCLSSLAYDFWTDSLFAAFALTAFAFRLLAEKFKPTRSSPAAPAAR